MTKKGNAVGFTIPDFKMHYRTTQINTIWYLPKNTHIQIKNNQRPKHQYT